MRFAPSPRSSPTPPASRWSWGLAEHHGLCVLPNAGCIRDRRRKHRTKNERDGAAFSRQFEIHGVDDAAVKLTASSATTRCVSPESRAVSGTPHPTSGRAAATATDGHPQVVGWRARLRQKHPSVPSRFGYRVPDVNRVRGTEDQKVKAGNQDTEPWATRRRRAPAVVTTCPRRELPEPGPVVAWCR